MRLSFALFPSVLYDVDPCKIKRHRDNEATKWDIYTQEVLFKSKESKSQELNIGSSLLLGYRLSVFYNYSLMNSKASLAIIVIVMLLADSLNAVKWQAMGGGMNNTVISEIWKDLSANVDAAVILGTKTAYNNFLNELSERLNGKWAQAWNVAMTIGSPLYDTVLYGYAFNNQWMWYNGVPYANQAAYGMITLIVWKDYNCRDWKNIADGVTESSNFNSLQANAINVEIGKFTKNGLANDVWRTTFTMMDNLGRNSAFSSGGYSIIMVQDGNAKLYGRVCRVGDGFLYSYQYLLNTPIFYSPELGKFYLFQTR